MSKPVSTFVTVVSILCFLIDIGITYLQFWSRTIPFTRIQQVSPLYDFGLWRICASSSVMSTSRTINGNCVNIGPLYVPNSVVPTHIHFVRALMIISIFTVFAAAITGIIFLSFKKCFGLLSKNL